MAVFLARIVMPRSRSRSFESITRSATASLARKVPDWRSIASTSVVLPWSTWAMMAILRMLVLMDTDFLFSTNKASGMSRNAVRQAGQPKMFPLSSLRHAEDRAFTELRCQIIQPDCEPEYRAPYFNPLFIRYTIPTEIANWSWMPPEPNFVIVASGEMRKTSLGERFRSSDPPKAPPKVSWLLNKPSSAGGTFPISCWKLP